MSRTRAGGAVMSCCAHARLGSHARRVCDSPVSSRPAAHGLICLRPVFLGPVRSKPAPGWRCRRSRLSRYSHPRLPQGHVAATVPSCPFPPRPVHPLYWYVFRWDAATFFGWSFDPGRDILLCNHTLSLRRLRWP
jgi:hypothetical protein